MHAIDTPKDTTGHAHDLKEAGIEAVGLYLRLDRTSQSMVRGLHSVGIRLFSMYEKGKPTNNSYFSAAQGEADAKSALHVAGLLRQPLTCPTFYTVDYDASWADLHGPIRSYFVAAQRTAKAGGARCIGGYGSGRTLAYLIKEGLIHYGMLSGSEGWTGFEDFKPHAAIVQTKLDQELLGFDVDYDIVVDSSVVW